MSACEVCKRRVPKARGTSNFCTERCEKKAEEQRRFAHQLASWNASVAVGARVAVCKVRGEPEYETHTRSRAWALGHGEPVVLLEGLSGGYFLDFVRPLAEGETLPPLPELAAKEGAA